MPRRNRVDPFGEIVAIPGRGSLMGNRGCLHADAGEIVRRWKSKAWISCVTDYPGRTETRPLAAPGQYTVLFFSDETAALAAGHRPCAHCRREAYRAFAAAWATAGLGDGGAKAIDERLHRERTGGKQSPYRAEALPDGAMIGTIDRSAAWLMWRGEFRPWRFDGYGVAAPLPAKPLTPPSTLAVLTAGYRPDLGTRLPA